MVSAISCVSAVRVSHPKCRLAIWQLCSRSPGRSTGGLASNILRKDDRQRLLFPLHVTLACSVLAPALIALGIRLASASLSFCTRSESIIRWIAAASGSQYASVAASAKGF